MRMALMTWRQVESYLRGRTTIIIPVGSTEQHGPNGLVGTDHLVADGFALAIGEASGALVHPCLTVGMSLHHLAFPGGSSLRAATLARVLTDLVESLARQGFDRFYFVNGHGGNTAPARTAASDLLARRPELRWHWRSWWERPEVAALETELFGDRNGEHATPAEISIAMHLHPGLIRPIETCDPTAPALEWPASPEEFRKACPDGRFGSDPSLASAEAGRRLFELCVTLGAEELNRLETSQESTHGS